VIFQSSPIPLASFIPSDANARRRLILAWLASLIAHALLLFMALPEREQQQWAQPLIATLRSPPPAPEVQQTATPPEPVKPKLLTRQPQAGERPVLSSPPTQPAATRAEESTANAGAAGDPAAVTPAAPIPMAPAPGLDANGMRQYRIELASAARGFKVYPPLALERGLTGTAEIEVTLAADGRVLSVRLARSSGHALLDIQAREMLHKAAQRTPVPDSLRGREFIIHLPVVFDLKQE